MDVARFIRPLALATAASLVLAVMAGLGERRVTRLTAAETFLPAYAERLSEAHHLHITHGRGLSGVQGISVSRAETGWQLTQRWNYPANDELVTETLLALADIDVLEARTAQEDWHRALGLVAPEDLGKAIRFEVRDRQNAVLAKVLVGKTEKSESDAVQKVAQLGMDKQRFYIRREAEVQSWLARGRLPRNPEAAAWLDPALPRHDISALTAVSFATGRKDFTAIKLGEAWSLAGAEPWLAGFENLRPDDVALEDNINFDTARAFTLSYTDGLQIIYENVGAATVIWSRMKAEAPDGAAAAVKQQAAAINARFGGWALRFSADKTPILLPTAGDLGAQ